MEKAFDHESRGETPIKNHRIAEVASSSGSVWPAALFAELKLAFLTILPTAPFTRPGQGRNLRWGANSVPSTITDAAVHTSAVGKAAIRCAPTATRTLYTGDLVRKGCVVLRYSTKKPAGGGE